MAALVSFGAMATDYKGQLAVTINEDEVMMESSITVEKVGEQTYDLVLKNFVMELAGTQMPVGNIELRNIEGTTAYGYTTLKVDQEVNITDGDLEGVAMWMGPMLGPVPIKMTAKLNEQVLSVNIDIDLMSLLEQVIKVNFIGTDPEAAGTTGMKGDLNDDQIVDISDVNGVINLMLGKE